MRTREKTQQLLRGLGGAVLAAAMLWLALAAPGLLSDRDSIAVARMHEARR